MPAAKKSDGRPWKEGLKSSAGSLLLVRNRMIGWPTFSPCRRNFTKQGGGDAADQGQRRRSGENLALDRHGKFPSWIHSRTLRTAVVPTPAAHVPETLRPAWCGGLIRTGTAILISLAVERGEDPGKPGSYRGTAKD